MTGHGTSRRAVIGGIAALATALLRPAMAAYGLRSGVAGGILIDVQSGEIVDSLDADRAMIPASTVKSLTAYAALATLPPTARFVTRIAASAPLSGGVLRGDLHLLGGGDPVLDSDDLARLASQLRTSGLRRVEGRFLFDDRALPRHDFINRDQPWVAGYNPGLGGLNLNFNRVLMRWGVAGRGAVESLAMADGNAIPAASVLCEADREVSGFRYSREGGVERWRVPASLLRGKGRRWLPVRAPGHCTASVFRALCAREGIVLPEPSRLIGARGETIPLAEHRSDPAFGIAVKMLKFSNNLIAESLGAHAATALGTAPESVDDATAATLQLLRKEIPAFAATAETAVENHSGLSTRSRLTPRQLALVLAAGVRRFGPGFASMHRAGRLEDAGAGGGEFRSKTGTMHFVRCRCGFLKRGGRLHAFALMANEPERRAAADRAFDPYEDARPRGAKLWQGQARAFEAEYLRRWLG